MGGLGGDVGDEQAGGAGGVNSLGGGRLLGLGQDGLLDLQALGAALLDELGVLHRLLHGGGQTDAGHDLRPALRGDGVKVLQSVQALVHLALALFQLLVVDVVQGDVQAAHGELDGPAGTDDAAAHAGDAPDICNFHGSDLLCLKIQQVPAERYARRSRDMGNRQAGKSGLAAPGKGYLRCVGGGGEAVDGQLQ